MKSKPLPSKEEILAVYAYDPITGVFTNRRTGLSPKGRLSSGALPITMGNKSYYSHRLAWRVMTGEEPVGVIDHIDGDKTNDAFANLRDVTQWDNTRNNKRTRAGKFPGVDEIVKNNRTRWAARMRINGKLIHLGSFPSQTEAEIAVAVSKRICSAARSSA